MKNILIIGSKGFIGTHALEAFSNHDDYNAFGCDVVVDYDAKDYFLIDAGNSDFNAVFSETVFDVCINCSGAANVSDSISNPTRDFHLNTVNVFKILDAIRHSNPTCALINLSSAAVYGNPISLPVEESFDTQPISPYGWHKLQSEIICKEFSEQFEIKTVSLRVFSVYGPRLQKQLFWDLYKKTKQDEDILLWGTGAESRDFIYVTDLVSIFFLLIESDSYNGDVINIGNGEEVLISDAVKKFYGLFDKKIPYTFNGNSRAGDPNNWKADISKLEAIGYKRTFTFSQGLQGLYEWIREIESA